MEAEFFRTLNAFVEPMVRVGFGSPHLLSPTGMVVVETRGRRSGQPRRVPLAATVLEGCVFVSTVRGPRSQWLQNLKSDPRVTYWVGGRRHEGHALLFAPGVERPRTGTLPPFASAAAEAMAATAPLLGWAFAVLREDPRSP